MAAEFYVRIVAGLRACLALVFGSFSLVGGSVAATAAGKGALTAAHWVASLLFPVGIVLVGLGIQVLWASRRRDGSLWWRTARRALLALAALVVYWVILPISFAIVATERPRDPVEAGRVGGLGLSVGGEQMIEAAAKISPRAVFFIYGEDGQEVEAMLNAPYYEAAGQPKELWEVPGAGHTGGISARRAEYERRVIGFFGRELLGED